MGNKGNNRHIKRLASSKYVKVNRKATSYIVKPNPGRHVKGSNIALITVLKEKLNVVDTTSEALKVLRFGKISVNGKIVKDGKFPIGFNDVVSVLPSKEHFAVHVGKGGTFAISKEHALPFKVIGKYITKDNKTMIRLHNGNVMGAPEGVMVNDSVVLENGKATKVISMKAGSKCLVFNGTHSSEHGTIKEITKGTATVDATVTIDDGSRTFETLLENVIAIG